MQTIELIKESYLFELPTGEIKRQWYYELESNEWVIFENSELEPKYFFRLGDKIASNDLMANEILNGLQSGKNLNTIIQKLGKKKKREWTVYYHIAGKQIENTIERGKILLLELTKETYDLLE